MQVFDVTAVRNALEARLKSLESELHQVRCPGKPAPPPVCSSPWAQMPTACCFREAVPTQQAALRQLHQTCAILCVCALADSIPCP